MPCSPLVSSSSKRKLRGTTITEGIPYQKFTAAPHVKAGRAHTKAQLTTFGFCPSKAPKLPSMRIGTGELARPCVGEQVCAVSALSVRFQTKADGSTTESGIFVTLSTAPETLNGVSRLKGACH